MNERTPPDEAAVEETAHGKAVVSEGWLVLDHEESGHRATLMIGARREDGTLLYPVSEVAARQGASVDTETSSPREAYAEWPGPWEPARVAWRRS